MIQSMQRRSRPWRLTARLSLLFLALAFAQAALAIPDPCEGLPQDLGADRGTWLQYDLEGHFPLRDAKFLRSLTIKEVDDENLLGPRYRQQENAIVVPKDYFRLQCHMVLFPRLYLAESQADLSPIRKDIAACIRARRGLRTCLDDKLTAFIRRLELTRADVKPENIRNTALGLTLVAIRYQLAHEAGHVLLNNAKTADQLRKLDVELEADVRGIVAVFGDGNLLYAPLYALMSAAMVPGFPGDDIHGAAYCRLTNIQTAMTQLSIPLAAIQFVLDSKPGKNDTEDFLRRVADVAPLFVKEEFFVEMGARKQKCSNEYRAHLQVFEADINTINGALKITKAGKTMSLADPVHSRETLANYVPKTSAGSILRGVLLMRLAMLDPSQMDVPRDLETKNDFKLVERVLTLLHGGLENITAQGSDSYLPVNGLSEMLTIRLMAKFMLSPAGSDVRVISQQLYSALKDIENLFPLDREIRALRGLSTISPRDAVFAQSTSAARFDFISTSGAMAGRCDEIVALHERLRSSIAADATVALMDRAACERIGAISAQRMANQFKWRFQGP